LIRSIIEFLNIHHLELFYYVAVHGGISAAVRRMPYGIQQPAISAQMLRLEDAVGTILFHRRPFSLTPAGAKLFDEIRPFFARLGDLPAYVRGHAQQRLRLAAPARILRDYLPELLSNYKQRFRDFGLTLYDVNQGAAEELLRDGKIDVAITELERRPMTPLHSCELIRLPVVLVVPRRPACRSIRDLFRDGDASHKLIALPAHELITKQFQAGLKNLGLDWSTSIEVSSLDLIDIYCALGFGIGSSVLVPGRRIARGLRLLPLQRFKPLTIAALWRDGLSDVAQSFLNDVRAIARRINGSRNREFRRL
jgi:DNA-binding transcriptional LysR family regulator